MDILLEFTQTKPLYQRLDTNSPAIATIQIRA